MTIPFYRSEQRSCAFLLAITELSTEIGGEVSDVMSVQIEFALKLLSTVKTDLLCYF